MKEVTLITTFKKHEKQILQNNQMIGALVQDMQQIQQMVSGFLGVLRKLPGYDKAIKELADEHEATEKKTKEEAEAAEKQVDLLDSIAEVEAEEIEVVDPEVVTDKKLDLGKDD